MSAKVAARRVVLVIAALIVAVLVVALITTVTFIRRPLPDYSGDVSIGGLSSSVRVERDDHGIPQIYADTPTDLFMAQGYVNAQDQFFQMDYRRHMTAGRLAELVGDVPAAVAADKAIRTMGWRHVAEQEWKQLPPKTRTYLSAYADGVNAYLADRSTSQVALEYTVLGLNVNVSDIEPWSPIDSLAWLKAMAWDLKGSFSQELERAAVYGRTGSIPMVRALFPDYPTTKNLPILPTASEITRHNQQAEKNSGKSASAKNSSTKHNSASGASATDQAGTNARGGTVAQGQTVAQGDSSDNLAASWAEAVGTPAGQRNSIDDALAALHAVPHPLGAGEDIGSNSWVVSGEHTATGKPILSNDPHLAPSAPGIWYQEGLHCNDVSAQCPFDVAGFGFAGMPGIIIGHNDKLAWGLTNLASDASDFFLEKTYADGTYLYDGERKKIQERHETIKINGADPIEMTVRSTDHGPIISEAIPGTDAAAKAPVPDSAPAPGDSGYEVAFSWTALQPGTTMEAVFAINTAHNSRDIAKAAALFDVPSQNIVFATTEGDIGYQAPGKIPTRKTVPAGPVPANGTWPRPGWDPDYDWQGFIPAKDLPAQVNPDSGIIVAANQPVQSLVTHPELGQDFDYGYRAQQIRDELTRRIDAGHKLTVADMNSIQLVQKNPAATALLPALHRVAARMDDNPFVQNAAKLLDDWDGVNDADSAAAAYFSAVWANVMKLTFWDQVPPEQRPAGSSRSIAVITQLLNDEDNPWWDDRTTVNVVEQRDEILERALIDARDQLTVQLGKDPSAWKWGRLHVLTPTHPVLGSDAVPAIVANYFNLPGEGLGGGPSIVDATGWSAAAWDEGYPDFSVNAVPSMRMVVDMANLDHSTWVNLTGNSGHPASKHYQDQYPAWVEGTTFTWAFGEKAVASDSKDTLTLKP